MINLKFDKIMKISTTYYRTGVINILALVLLLSGISLRLNSQNKEEVYNYLKSLGNGSYLFGQVATWVHNENPDMDHQTNWLKKVNDHTGKMPRYGCITYDYDDNPFTDADWNEGVKKMWERGLIPGVYNFFANPMGGKWRDTVSIDPIFDSGDNPIKSNWYKQMDRMANNMQWLKERGITVVYTPFVELNDKNKWHAREGSKNGIRLYRLIHDYFTSKGLDNILWAYHTTQGHGALEEYYPGDEYVDIIGKSGYGTGLIFSEYEWAVEKKKNHGKVIWWAELGIRGKSDAPRDCLDVLAKLENSFPEMAGFVFWSDDGFYNVVGNLNGPELMANPKIVTLKSK
jgi:mannan endo-1,4-beta-mannosidase